MNEYKRCEICLDIATEYHHRIFRSQNKALIKCEMNLIPLCRKCHSRIHSKSGHDIDQKIKLEFQNKLETIFIKEYFTEKETREILQISENASKILFKTLKRYKEGYKRGDIIRACMGGKLII